ncbi:MAG TPA: DeoR/GlpR family DNA-binding transcription regulator [Dongiaceae bacterium]|jgi:DeoR family glycerol-3-phosphate regulon repressor|nr:DeoR/GlpR family DNA-binding transcription regulator [Dongiaceae bacterium]
MLDEPKAAALAEGKLPATARQARLAELLRRSGFLSVAETAERLGVSSMTIRRDLESLEARGILTRTHGGAIAAEGGRGEVFDAVEPDFDQRRRYQAAAKAMIAAAAARLVGPNETVALDVGTSVLALAKELAVRSDLKFITNNLPAATLLSGRGSPVYLLGGQLRAPEMAVIGAVAHEQARNYNADHAFIGVSGVMESGCYDYSPEDTEVKRAFIERARRVVVLCDSSKFDHRAMARICELRQCHVVVTEIQPPAHLARALRAAGTELVVAA